MSNDGTKLMYLYYANTSFERLRSYFGHVRSGNDIDYRTPLFDEKPRDEVMDAWQQILEPKLKGMEGLQKFEDDLRQKVGPLSIMKPLSERISDIDAYYEEIHLPQKPILPSAREALIKDWKPKIGGLRLRELSATWDNMKKSTSSGSPYFTRRGNCIDRTWPARICDNMQYLHDADIYKLCATLGWRGQEGGPDDSDVKQRVIWMFPLAANIQELSLYQPLIAACQRFNLVPSWNGNDAVDEEMTLLFDSKAKDDVIICTDFTRFDQHFNPEMQKCAYDVLWSLTTHDARARYWFDEVYPVKYNIDLMYDWGKVRKGNHGMASGSGGTNADESLAHRCLQHEAAITSKVELNRHSMCLGDDGVLTYPGITLEHVLDTYTSHGLEMNEDKQDVSKEEATYLRRWYSQEYRIDGKTRGVYSTYRALGKLMGQERFYDPKQWGPEMLVMRSLSIIENVKWHPCRNEFLEFCVKGDKYRLGLDIPGFFDNLAKSYESSELAQSFASYSAGDTTGINDWWVVKTLKSLR